MFKKAAVVEAMWVLGRERATQLRGAKMKAAGIGHYDFRPQGRALQLSKDGVFFPELAMKRAGVAIPDAEYVVQRGSVLVVRGRDAAWCLLATTPLHSLCVHKGSVLRLFHARFLILQNCAVGLPSAGIGCTLRVTAGSRSR